MPALTTNSRRLAEHVRYSQSRAVGPTERPPQPLENASTGRHQLADSRKTPALRRLDRPSSDACHCAEPTADHHMNRQITSASSPS
jgi:hypothetical protein